MKHYLSHDTNGKIVGVHTHHHHQTQLGGWPDDRQLEDPGSEDETVQSLRGAQLGGANGAIAFIAYNCPCAPTETRCACAPTKAGNARVAEGKLVDKKTGSLVIDGSPAASGSTVKRPPGTKIKFSVASAGAVDGSKVVVQQGGPVAIIDSDKPVELAFADGMTPTFEVVAPTQGMTGGIMVNGDDFAPIYVYVRGWGA